MPDHHVPKSDPDSAKQTEPVKSVERPNFERIAYCVFWGAILIVCCMAGGVIREGGAIDPDTGTVSGVLGLLSLTILSTYGVGSGIGFISFKDHISEDLVREHPELMRFSWPRFFREGIYSVGFTLVVGIGIGVAGLVGILSRSAK